MSSAHVPEASPGYIDDVDVNHGDFIDDVDRGIDENGNIDEDDPDLLAAFQIQPGMLGWENAASHKIHLSALKERWRHVFAY